MSNLDDFRRLCLRSVADLGARKTPWPGYREEIVKILGSSPNEQQIFDLGSHLKQIFKSEARSRSQADLSRGGASWEILICWYLNLIFWNTNVVALRPRKSLTPQVLVDAMSVKVKGVHTNKETDLIVIEVPKTEAKDDLDLNAINKLICDNPKSANVGVIQCKTNWNDNAQIPMLWNIVYSAQKLEVQNVVVGSNGYSPASFGRFSYAFVTVPTNTGEDKDNFKLGTTAVVRVQGMTGGNYWGNPSISGVADSVSEYFGRNFGHVFDGGVQRHISKKLLANPDVVEMFLNFDF